MIAASSRAEFSLKRLSYFPEPALITTSFGFRLGSTNWLLNFSKTAKECCKINLSRIILRGVLYEQANNGCYPGA